MLKLLIGCQNILIYVPNAKNVPTEIFSSFNTTIPIKYNATHPNPHEKSITNQKQSLNLTADLNEDISSFSNSSHVSSVSFSAVKL